MTSPAELQRALARCADEPIAVPGAIQPHGALLAVRVADLVVLQASANVTSLLGLRDPVGRTLPELVEQLSADVVGGDLAELNPLALALPAGAFDAVLHRTGELLLVELEPAARDEAPWYRSVPSALQRLQDAETLERFTEVLVREVAAVTGFDRVMVYRFDRDWNGEVVAEHVGKELDPFLGLRFPASDIPAQARALYTRNWLRLIPDARYTPVPVGPPGPEPLDLSEAVLRSVSPVHLQYLANMGVVASMSVSLVVEGKLWGLIACHSYAGPHFASYRVRAAAEFLGRTASALLPTKLQRGEYEASLAAAGALSTLTSGLSRRDSSVLDALTRGEHTVLDLVPAGGAAVQLRGELRLLGDTPSAADVRLLADRLWLEDDEDREVVVTESMARRDPLCVPLTGTASGVLAVPLAAGPDAWVMWLRPEVLQAVTWGGDPRAGKVSRTDDDGLQLTPRASFAAWTETVRNTSTAWSNSEVQAAARLGREVTNALLARRRDDDRLARVLQRTLLLDDLPELPGLELSARYLPSRSEVVGADWYDLVPLPSGRVVAVIGDVAGHGMEYAAVTAELRHALRAYLLREVDAATALQRLATMVEWSLPSALATVLVVDVDIAARRATVLSAGHPPVLRVSGSGASLVDVPHGTALGLPSRFPAPTVIDLADDVLVLYTDGLVERRREDPEIGYARLRSAAGGNVPDLSTLCDRLLDGTGARAGDDDVTMLALRLTGAGSVPLTGAAAR
ncbi:MAG: SpoIIE family protein phosphatase [Actinomycetota bacterium]|nr:SpoIIE family protein phosphatase [Actinomycetota bacterium]